MRPPPPSDFFPNAIVVVFGWKKGYGLTGALPDDAQWPRSIDDTVEGLTDLLEQQGDALASMGALPRRVSGAVLPRVALPAAQFRPGNPCS